MPSPFEEFNSTYKDRWNILVDIPDWERNNIIYWIEGVLCDDYGYYNKEILLSIQSRYRIVFTRDIGLPIGNWSDIMNFIRTDIVAKPIRVIFLIELLIKFFRDNYDSMEFYGRSKNVSDILKLLDENLENGSKWRVVFSYNSEAGLIERVNHEIQQIAIDLNNHDLDNAWSNAFGVNNKAQTAIEDAQRAIEYEASAAELIDTKTNVYGSFLRSIRDTKSSMYFSVAKPEFDKSLEYFTESDNNNTHHIDETDKEFANWFCMGLDLIQKANPKRHASRDANTVSISLEASRQSVLIATMLCEMISKKYIYKK